MRSSPIRCGCSPQSGKLTFETPQEEQAASEKLAENYEKFSGVTEALECTHAMDLYGPTGTAVKSLLKRRE